MSIGMFYGLGIGPGDPDLITLKSVKILKMVDFIISPIARKGSESIALNIAKEHIREDAEIIKLDFPMLKDDKLLNEKWKSNSEFIINLLKEGKKGAFITLGDSTTFSTYMYIVPYLKEAGIKIETIPGITSFATISSKLNMSLVSGEENLCIYPMTKEIEKLENIIENNDNIVLMKVSANPKGLVNILKKYSLESKFVLVSRCSNENEKISYNIDDINESIPYLSTIIIKK